MNNTEKVLAYSAGVLAVFVLFVVFMLYGAWVGAFVSVHLWSWFVVPTFGVAPLKMPMAFGLSLLVSLWTHHHRPGVKEERSTQERVIEIIGQIASPWFVLLCGYVCQHFFM